MRIRVWEIWGDRVSEGSEAEKSLSFEGRREPQKEWWERRLQRGSISANEASARVRILKCFLRVLGSHQGL